MQGLPANFWRLWGASAASNLADGLFLIALPLLAVRLTDSPILIAGLALVGRLPWLVFVLVAGALADRLDRRRRAGVRIDDGQQLLQRRCRSGHGANHLERRVMVRRRNDTDSGKESIPGSHVFLFVRLPHPLLANSNRNRAWPGWTS